MEDLQTETVPPWLVTLDRAPEDDLPPLPTGRPSAARRTAVSLVAIAATVLLVVVATVLSRGGSPARTRVLAAPGFVTSYPAGWTLRRTHDRFGAQDELSSTGRPLDRHWVPPRGTIGISVMTYSPTQLVATYGPAVLTEAPAQLLGQTVGIPPGEQNAAIAAPAHGTRLGGLPAEAISYRYTYAGVPNLQTDVVARHGSSATLVELDVDPTLAPAANTALARILGAWRWTTQHSARSRPVATGGTDASSSFGPFAGYDWEGAPITSVQAAWKVPRIQLASSPGRAGTWIGAAAQQAGKDNPFIQVGTNEERPPPAYAQYWPDAYYAFWSSTAKSYHPIALFDVEPGDQIVARLTQVGLQRWRVSIQDRTLNVHRSFLTRDEADWHFSDAQWMQEDITDNATNKPFPYPDRMTSVKFSQLRVNSVSPNYAGAASSWMSENGRALAPSPFADDSFTVSTATISRAGHTYLRIAGAEDTATSRFGAEMSSWSAVTARATIAAQSARYAAELRSNIQALSRARWPTRAQPLIRNLIAVARQLLSQTQAAALVPTQDRQTWITAFNQKAADIGQTAHDIRRTLDIPEQ